MTEKQKQLIQIAGVVIGALGLIWAMTRHGGVAVSQTPPVVLGGGANPGSAAGINPIQLGMPGVVPSPDIIAVPTTPPIGAVTNSNPNQASTCCPGIQSVQYTTAEPTTLPPLTAPYLPPSMPAVDSGYPTLGRVNDNFTKAFGTSTGGLGPWIKYVQTPLQNLFNYDPGAAQLQSDAWFARASQGLF